jgi:phosphatidylglycerol---prolipoprotein diacylglyceryl transferase
MIPYEPHPILFSFGNVQLFGQTIEIAIRYYSLAYILGFILAYFSLKKAFNKERAEDMLTWIILATIIGGRVGEFIFYQPKTLLTDPLEVLYIWQGGMSFHGALLALALTLWYYCRKHKISFWKVGDALVLPAAIALAFGRIANFLNGELVGTVTSVPWCMEFPGFRGCRHPSQLYESFYSFVLAGILYWQSKKKHPEGYLFTLFLLVYGIFRFIFNFWRDDLRILGISEGQLLSAVMIITAVYLLATKYKSKKRAGRA